MSWKTVMAYMVFCIIPLVMLIYAQTQISEQSSGRQLTIMEEMAKHIHTIQNIGMSLLYPVLTGKLVDKSQITLKVNKLDKKMWLLLYIIMMAVVIAIHLNNAIVRFNSIMLPIAFLIFYTLNMMGIIVAMLVICFVCSPIIEEYQKRIQSAPLLYSPFNDSIRSLLYFYWYKIRVWWKVPLFSI